LFKEVLTSLFGIGYPQIFIDRQVALQILYNNLKSQERVLTNKRVCRVEHEPEGVKFYTKDGSTYTGDFVVGADGVHSAVRQEMWRIADEDGLKVFKFDPLRG
jgi:2-polyprenyl-6-methoxyphenol hydroxylase-like FAD-dependent oxidoreductase